MRAELNGGDAICFTAGIGENSPVIRELICSPYLRTSWRRELDKAKSNNIRGKERSHFDAICKKTKVLVVPTNEAELEIGRHALRRIVKGK